MFNESWKTNGQPATVEDCRKYVHCNARLLAKAEGWNGIHEVTVQKVTSGGMVYVGYGTGFMMGGCWMMPEDLIVIEILPSLDLEARQQELT